MILHNNTFHRKQLITATNMQLFYIIPAVQQTGSVHRSQSRRLVWKWNSGHTTGSVQQYWSRSNWCACKGRL